MQWFYRKKRWTAAVLLAVLALTAVPENKGGGMPAEKSPALTAWWGTLYPKFCFARGEAGRKVKLSFRLAELLDW